jgi:hypothetical protein
VIQRRLVHRIGARAYYTYYILPSVDCCSDSFVMMTDTITRVFFDTRFTNLTTRASVLNSFVFHFVLHSKPTMCTRLRVCLYNMQIDCMRIIFVFNF